MRPTLGVRGDPELGRIVVSFGMSGLDVEHAGRVELSAEAAERLALVLLEEIDAARGL